MPARIEPCLALLVDEPPKGSDWVFEVKLDGYRLAVHVEPGRVRVITRGGYDWTERFPTIADGARLLAVETAILDGEAVVLDEKGRSDFGMLQRALGRLPSPYEASAVIFYVFDLLYLDGRDLRGLPLRHRRRLLKPLVAGCEGAIRLSEEVEANGEEFLRIACAHGLEGIIAKHREKPYRSGRGDSWQKITCTRRDSFLIVGYEPSVVPGAIGSALLAARKGNELVYVGDCGTGWSRQEAVKRRAARRDRDKVAGGERQAEKRDLHRAGSGRGRRVSHLDRRREAAASVAQGHQGAGRRGADIRPLSRVNLTFPGEPQCC